MKFWLFAAVAVSFVVTPRGFAGPAKQPNVICVLIDDMGWGDFSCFGNKEVKTENMDRLASEGIRFSQFYVNAPICSPSRTAISTGQYPQRWRITSFLAERAINEKRGMAQWLDPSAPMLARTLKEAGYATGHFGKWHMGGQRDVGEAPLITTYGFDESLTNFEGLGPRVLPLCDAHDGKPPTKHAMGSDTLGHGAIQWVDRSLVTKSYVNEALGFIRKAESDKKPFFVNLWPDDVHGPWFPPAARRGDGTKHKLYSGVLDTADEQIGVLFDYLRSKPELRDNTLVIVFSDNGPEDGAGSAGPFRGGKGMLYEGGIRSPLIVWAPGFIPADRTGRHNESSVLFAIDLFPSVLTITGTTPPKDVKLDGEDVSAMLLGKSEDSRKTPLFFRRPPDRPGTAGNNLPDLAVRDGNWKLLCELDGSTPMLYDLNADRSETTNVATKHPEIVTRLTAAVLQWHKSMPPDNGPNFRVPAGGKKKGK